LLLPFLHLNAKTKHCFNQSLSYLLCQKIAASIKFANPTTYYEMSYLYET
jgi:hypothetical protein